MHTRTREICIRKGCVISSTKQIGIVFETATPFDTPRLMAELVAWLAEARDLRQLHPLLIVAVFIVKVEREKIVLADLPAMIRTEIVVSRRRVRHPTRQKSNDPQNTAASSVEIY